MNKQLWPVLGGVLALVLLVGALVLLKGPQAPRMAPPPRGKAPAVARPREIPAASVSTPAQSSPPGSGRSAEVPKVTPAPSSGAAATPADRPTSGTVVLPDGTAGARAKQGINLPPGAAPAIQGTPFGTGGYKPPRTAVPAGTSGTPGPGAAGNESTTSTGYEGSTGAAGGGSLSTPTPSAPLVTPGPPTMTPMFTPDPTEEPTPLPTEEPTPSPEPSPTPTASPTPSMTPSAPGYTFSVRQGPTTNDTAQVFVSYTRLQQATDQVGLIVLTLSYNTTQLRFTGGVFSALGAVPPMDAVEGPAGRVNISLAGNGQAPIAPGDLVRIEFTRRTPLLDTPVGLGINDGGGGVRSTNLDLDLTPACRTSGFVWTGVPTPTPTPGPTPTTVETATGTPSPTPSVVPTSTPAGS